MSTLFLTPFLHLGKNFELKSAVSVVIAIVTFLIGDPKSAIISGIVVLIALDWVTGIIAAWKFKELNSRKALQGGIKILVFFSLCVVAYQASTRIHPVLLGFLDDMVYAYIATTEAISILENIKKLCSDNDINLPFVGFIVVRLQKLQDNLNKSENKISCDKTSDKTSDTKKEEAKQNG